jgi:hypothetical protein
VANEQNGRTEILVVDCGDEQAILPVFSGEGEAEVFVSFAVTRRDEWRIMKTSADELVLALCDLCARVNSIALDPCPEMLATKSIGLVCLDSKRFVRWIAECSTRLSSEEQAHRSNKA